MAQHQKTIQEHLALQILLADRLVKSAKEVESSKFDCSDLAKLAVQLTHLLRSTARLVAGSATPTFYDRPLRSIFSHLSSNLHRAQTLVRKCKHRNSILRQVFAITTAADVRKVSNLLESSIADLKWLLSVFDNNGVNLSLPPIASNDPVLAWVWSNIAAVQHSDQLKDRVDAANSLASLAGDSDRNKKMIIEEDGVPPLLKLLKEGASPESQIAAANTLFNLAADQEKVAGFLPFLAVPTIVKALNDSTTVIVRTNLINLVSRMAEMDSWVQEEFGKENVIRPIVTFLANDNEIGNNGGFRSSSSSSLSFRVNKETDISSPEEKRKLQMSCGRALWILAKGSLLNSRKITETKALICLSKLIEHETGELQANCLMTVMELATVAELNADLRRQAFKPNSPAARTVLDQLLRVVNQEHNPKLVVPAITAIGSLARTFPAKETRVIGPLVSKLDHNVSDVPNEAVMALTKFVSPDNFNCVEHSKAIIDFDGVPHLMSFLKNNDNFKIRVHGLKLLCYLALHVGNSNALEQARALSVMEAAARSVVTQYPELKELKCKKEM
ncbi:Armadillo, partial [Cynara cardunculus var. scolymus]